MTWYATPSPAAATCFMAVKLPLSPIWTMISSTGWLGLDSFLSLLTSVATGMSPGTLSTPAVKTMSPLVKFGW